MRRAALAVALHVERAGRICRSQDGTPSSCPAADTDPSHPFVDFTSQQLYANE